MGQVFYIYADKELTNSLVLASEWYVIWFDKNIFRDKSHKMTDNMTLLKDPYTNTCLYSLLPNE